MEYLSSLLCQAARMAAEAHDGATREDGRTPYLIHAMEAASIAATMTEDEDILAAAVLHGVLKNSSTTEEELRETVGGHVTNLVLAAGGAPCRAETEEQWQMQRQRDIERLVAEYRLEVKMVVLADRLSDMRALAKEYNLKGERLWAALAPAGRVGWHWYYQAITDALQDLNSYPAWHELANLVWEVFSQDRDSDQLRFDFSARNARELDMLLW